MGCTLFVPEDALEPRDHQPFLQSAVSINTGGLILETFQRSASERRRDLRQGGGMMWGGGGEDDKSACCQSVLGESGGVGWMGSIN